MGTVVKHESHKPLISGYRINSGDMAGVSSSTSRHPKWDQTVSWGRGQYGQPSIYSL